MYLYILSNTLQALKYIFSIHIYDLKDYVFTMLIILLATIESTTQKQTIYKYEYESKPMSASHR